MHLLETYLRHSVFLRQSAGEIEGMEAWLTLAVTVPRQLV